MKVLLTGGAGFIGSHVADSYLLDICSAELEKVFKIEKPDIVNYHAARDPIPDARINSQGLLNVLEYKGGSMIRVLEKEIFGTKL